MRKWRQGEDMIITQLTTMSNRLPPLSPFTSNFRLDPWQKRVLQLIDAGKSVVISAPTSSGKTVLSTYVATLGRMVNPNNQTPIRDDVEELDEENDGYAHISNKDRVLFVVPTEPLVWQVAAHFARHILNGNVALVTDQMIYSPHQNLREPPAVVVGTPRALETALTKIRGKNSFLERKHQVDRAQVVGGFDHYGWVVYDEIHILDGEEGESLQRLIRLMKCNFLALSATVGNAEELRSWLEYVRGEQINAEVVDVSQDANGHRIRDRRTDPEESRLVKLQTHHDRFLNIQRHIWTKSPSSDALELRFLHPLSAVSLKFLQMSGFSTCALPMTPRDCYELYAAMHRHYPAGVVDDLSPHNVFTSTPRITLHQVKDYEDHLKSRLQDLSHTHQYQTQLLLDEYQLQDLPKEYDICDLVLNLKRQGMLPCLVFHLNVFELISIFKNLLAGVESRQKSLHPKYYSLLRQRHLKQQAELDDILRQYPNERDRIDAQRAGLIPSSIPDVDYGTPHPDFVFSNAPISRMEFDKICEEVKIGDRFEGDVSKHALMRALRRGIGVYINDHHFTAYRMAVMKLAMQGKLGVVLSDSSLAYGVNMPFRSCVFCGEMGGSLTPLMAQQMAGRSGRRGLDTQGHLIYAGARASFVQELMLAKIPAIIGREPRYHSQFLQEMLSIHSNPKSFPNQMLLLGGLTLEDYIHAIQYNITPFVPNFRDVSLKTLQDFHLIEECDKLIAQDNDELDFNNSCTLSGYRPYQGYTGLNNTIPEARCAQLSMIWELRDCLSDSLLLGIILPYLYDCFLQHRNEVAEDVSNQHLFLLYLMMTVDRSPYRGIVEGYCPHDLVHHPFVTNRGLTHELEDYQARLRQIYDRIQNLDVPKKELMMQSCAIGEPLDATVFDYIINPPRKENIDVIPPAVRQYLKEKFLRLSMKLVVMHNNLMLDHVKYKKFEGLMRYLFNVSGFLNTFRKCFRLLQYLSRDMIQNIMDFDDVSSSETERLDK